ncbi:myosin-11 [Dorcoceras hygrometricum]|uniref:Myosin-11 n=1 Tax=Dorcoceras hygrometricum TaxID=472368 RepID=A0A2Z7D821_9LAMI|nr:myosin-11 [Dorcoceras hygrometricum]
MWALSNIVGESVEHSPAEVKAKKRKVSSVPSQPEQASVSKSSLRSRGRPYSTRSSLRLVSRFSNTTAEPIDLVSSPHVSGDGSGHDDAASSGSVSTEGDDGKTPPDSPLVYEEMYSDDQRVQQHDTGLDAGEPFGTPFSPARTTPDPLEGPVFDVDLSFADVVDSTPSQLAKIFPSTESHFLARTPVRNFLDLGLHQLGESQSLAMILVVLILRASPEFSSEYPLLVSIATIFSDSDAAQAKSTLLMAKLEDFHNKRRQAENMEKETMVVRTQIKDLTAEYDANESEVKELEEKIHEHRMKMASFELHKICYCVINVST